MDKLKTLLFSCFAIGLQACDSGSSSGDTEEVITAIDDTPAFFAYVTPTGVEECSTEDINRRVEFDMRDYYIFYDRVPELIATDFDAPEEYIRALRVEPADIYSSVGDAATQASLFEVGETQGYGFWIQRDPDERFRIRDIPVGSPVDLAGIKRGDEVLEVNGIPYGDLTNEQFQDAFQRVVGHTAELLVQTNGEAPRLAEISFSVYRIQTAGPTRSFSTSANPNAATIGYLPVDSFLATTRDEIDIAFEELRANTEIEELILDLRYNGGGRINVANYLASIIGGESVSNRIATSFEFNDKYTDQDFFVRFDQVQNPLNLSRVIVLTTEFSASASELVINSLRPHMEVVVVGQRTEGKAFISSAREYCGKAINAMSGIGFNTLRQDVIGGLDPTCVVEDTWFVENENPVDSLLGTALNIASGEACEVMVASNGIQLRSTVRANTSQSTLAESRSDIPRTFFVDEFVD